MNQSAEQHREDDPLAFLAGGGEMGRRTREFDWSQTPVGPVSEWPQSLKIAVRIMLSSRYAMWLGWGVDFTFFYNDAYAAMTLGPKHPWALGRSAREVWSEIWGDIGPRAESVVRTSEATWDEGLLLFLERKGFREETYHTFSYSPIPGDSGVGGMLCVVTEDTERTLSERRLRTLRELAARTTEEAMSAEHACQTAARTLAANRYDLPFVLIYLLDDDTETARLAGCSGLSIDSPAAPSTVELGRAIDLEVGWSLGTVLESGHAQIIANLEKRLGPVPSGIWPEPPKQAVVLPVAKPGQSRPAGFIVAGISPRLLLNDAYRWFLDLLAGHVATAVANARAYGEERRRAETLAELDRAKTTFFSNISHEFRTPLTLMLGPVEDLLASAETELTPVAAGQLEVIRRNGLRLLRLVNTLLDFSRIEAGRVRALFQPTDLATLTTDLASVFRSACQRAGLRLVVDCKPLAQPVYVDRDMWEKIVLNLLSNAYKFTFDGEIRVSLRETEPAIELQVSDTGTGIPAEEMPRLFERFHRVQNARGRTHEGSGIGLALVHELIELHGGSITAHSVVGQGTTFTVSIPLGMAHLPSEQIGGSNFASTNAKPSPFVEEAVRWSPGTEDAKRPRLSELPTDFEPANIDYHTGQSSEVNDRPRILVADDNADMRQYVCRLLAADYSVEAVSDGLAALAAAKDNPPDLVLSDVMMPRLDGFGLLCALRSNSRTKTIPVIMLSARAGEESRVEGIEAGVDDYLIKPFSARELLARVSAQLQLARLRREANESLLASERRLTIEVTAMNRLHALVSRLLICPDLASALDEVLESSIALLGADMGNIQLVDPHNALLQIVAHQGFSPAFLEHFRYVNIDDSIACARVVKDGIRTIVEDVQTDPAYVEHRHIAEIENWHGVQSTPLISRGGDLLGVLSTHWRKPHRPAERDLRILDLYARQAADFIDRIRAEQLLRDEARRKNEFLATLAHELRNPLAPLRNGLQILKLTTSDDPSVEHARNLMERQLGQMVRLIDDLMDISRINRGKVELRPERVPITKIIQQAVETSQPLIEAGGHHLTIHIPPEPIYVDADVTRMAQVFSNLMNNAAKYTQSEGQITLTVERQGSDVVISVQDNGVGIPATMLPRIFEMFTQVDRSLEKSQGGLGIGLWLVQKLVELHAGSVEAKSDGLAQGSEFIVRLPVVLPMAAERTSDARQMADPPKERRRILVADDNRDSATSLALMLKIMGNETQTAHDGLHAIEVAKTFQPDVVLLDIGMPKLNGYEACRWIRKEPWGQSIILVALTGWGQDEDKQRSHDAGFDAHLIKPVEPAALEKLLAELRTGTAG